MEEQFDFYPPKPVLPKKDEKSGWSMTVLSLVLFVASFMILFADRVQFLVFLIIVLFIQSKLLNLETHKLKSKTIEKIHNNLFLFYIYVIILI